MRSVITLFWVLVASKAAVAVEPDARATGRISAGTGVEARFREDVNPDSPAGRLLPHFFVQYRMGHWGAAVEGGMEESDSNAGALKIQSRTYQTGLWGRYEFRDSLRWSPFTGVGGGAYFDEITSSYQSERDVRSGRRGFWGVNGGISHVLWEHLLLEGELRALLVQDRKDATISAILRLGFVL